MNSARDSRWTLPTRLCSSVRRILTGTRPAEGRLATPSPAATRRPATRPLDQINAIELQQPQGRVGVARRSAAGRRDRRDQRARRCRSMSTGCSHHVGAAPHRRLDRSRHGQDPVGVPGADDPASRVLDALEPRQGRGVSRASTAAAWSSSTRPASSCTRSMPRPVSRSKAGAAGAGGRFPEDRARRPAEGPDRRLGAVDEAKKTYDPNGHAARARLHHHLLAADRRQRRAHRRQLGRAGLQPDAASRTCRATSSAYDARTGKFLGSST